MFVTLCGKKVGAALVAPKASLINKLSFIVFSALNVDQTLGLSCSRENETVVNGMIVSLSLNYPKFSSSNLSIPSLLYLGAKKPSNTLTFL
ncbi:MAG: hypothetical protein O3C05_02995 [Proteobacteria bacterium]|nr:hypothetical protein [Pseudomonadota bacterium]